MDFEEYILVRDYAVVAKKGNSPAAMAGRAAAVVRRNNQWKVRVGVLTKRQLRRWAMLVQEDCRKNPEDFKYWHGVVRYETPKE